MTSRLAQLRRLLPAWTLREVRAQYRQSAFDLGWSLITPAVLVAGYGLVLTQAFGVDGDGVPYVAFAWTGVVVWQFVSNALMRGTSSLVWSADLVRKVAFPREVVPLATVLSSCLDLVVGLAVLAVVMVVQGVRPDEHVVAMVPVLAVLVAWTAAVAMVTATATAFLRDLSHGLGVLLRIGIFVTPVMYPVSQIPHRFRWIVSLNPVSVAIEALRDCVLRGRWPNWSTLGAHAAATLVLAAGAWWYVQRVEGRMADVI